jgi:GTP cyclohydrolase IA
MNQEKVSFYFRKLMEEGLGLDLQDPNLEGTPERIGKMYVRELFQNIGKEPEENFSVFPNSHNYDQMIVVDNIHFRSTCSHHFLTFRGKADLVYIPDKKLIGLSKPSRIINFYSNKPQLQEALTHEVLNYFVKAAEPKGAMIILRAVHSCVSDRGSYQYDDSGMTTSAIYGVFRDHLDSKLEALSLIQLSRNR